MSRIPSCALGEERGPTRRAMISSEAKFSEMLAEDNVRQETLIWRCMDLQRFVAVLADCHLWFTKAAVYEDPYEAFCAVIRRGVSPSDRDSLRELVGIGGTKEVSRACALKLSSGGVADDPLRVGKVLRRFARFTVS